MPSACTTCYRLHAAEGGLWLAVKDGRLYRSTDRGATFTKVAGVGRTERLGFGAPMRGRKGPAVFLAGAVGGAEGVFRSDDAGATWTRIDDERHRFGSLRDITGNARVPGRVYLATSGHGILYGEPR